MASGHDSALDELVAAWIDDLADPEQAVEGIVSLGRAAIGPLSAYLERGPQLVSQPREFAVRMLSRLHGPVVVERLRGLLHSNPLRSLSPALAESEYRVKDAAMTGLVEQMGAAAADDVAFSVRHEHLPSAVRAAGRLRLWVLAPSLTALLADDVLADTAADALHAQRPESTTDVLLAIEAWLRKDADTPRMRLALIRGLLWLQAASERLPTEMCRQALGHSCVSIRAAAALTMDVTRPSDASAVALALAHGVLDTDGRLAAACRERLRSAIALPIEPLVAAWQANAEMDVYGNNRYPSATSRRTLLDIMLLRAKDTESLSAVALGVSPDDLAEALFRCNKPGVPWLETMLRHPDGQVRLAATACLWCHPWPVNQRWLVECLGDHDRRVRRKATVLLEALIASHPTKLAASNFPASAWRHAPWTCLRLLARSARNRQ